MILSFSAPNLKTRQKKLATILQPATLICSIMSVWKKTFFFRNDLCAFLGKCFKTGLNFCVTTLLFLFLKKVVVIGLLLFLILNPNMVVEEQAHKVEVFCDWLLEILKIFFLSFNFNLHSIQK